MANVKFDWGREGFLSGAIDWDSDDIRVMLVKSTYTLDQNDKFVSDLGAVDNGRSAALGSKTTTSGIAGSADTTLTATDTAACNALVLFKYNADDALARLIAYYDVGVNFPLNPTSGDTVNVICPPTTNKWFQL